MVGSVMVHAGSSEERAVRRSARLRRTAEFVPHVPVQEFIDVRPIPPNADAAHALVLSLLRAALRMTNDTQVTVRWYGDLQNAHRAAGVLTGNYEWTPMDTNEWRRLNHWFRDFSLMGLDSIFVRIRGRKSFVRGSEINNSSGHVLRFPLRCYFPSWGTLESQITGKPDA